MEIFSRRVFNKISVGNLFFGCLMVIGYGWMITDVISNHGVALVLKAMTIIFVTVFLMGYMCLWFVSEYLREKEERRVARRNQNQEPLAEI